MTHRSQNESKSSYCECRSHHPVNVFEASCQSMRQCLDNKIFKKYFIKEELPTSNRPCDFCSQSLKGIKMMWKVIVEKLFNVDVSKNNNKENATSAESVRSVVSSWQSEIEVQVDFVRKIANKKERIQFKESKGRHGSRTSKCLGTTSHKALTQQNVGIDAIGGFCTLKKSSGSLCLTKQLHCEGDTIKSNSSVIKHNETVDKACNTCYFLEEMIELDMYKNKLTQLEDELSSNINKVEELSKENLELKTTLDKINKKNDVIVFLDTVGLKLNQEEGSKVVNPITDSETIITVQNFSHETYKHVSLLQVLHKSNDPIADGFCIEETGERNKKDPMDLLNKVQNAFGEIVKREVMMIKRDSKRAARKSEINASYQKVKVTKSMLSFKTLSTCTLSNLVSNLHRECNV